MKVVDANLKAVIGEPGTEFSRDGVGTLWGKVERRTKSQSHFEFGKRLHAVETLLRLDVVSKNKRESSSHRANQASRTEAALILAELARQSRTRSSLR